MTIEAALLISAISVTFGIYQGASNLKRNERTEAKNDASELTTVIVKLENIGDGIKEIKSELGNIKQDINDITVRLVKVEESSKSAHKRLDTCEKYCKRMGEDHE